ncbi:MAG: efflux RND transporter periplasmic adaptor subunit [Methylobacteriaceae bacterium]|nr:efflux RND transporter periplasmic adaptor subunit [Methylobacteriaceae bacterium]
MPARPAFRLSLLALALAAPAAAGETTLALRQIDDLKAVIATVEPARQLVARARIGGTIVTLKVREGDVAAAGAEIAVVADPKIALQMQALAQRIRSQQAQRDQARIDFDRVQELQRRGVSTQSQLDQARTGLDVAERNLAAMQSDLKVVEQQLSEGAVLAPAAGRVLSVPVSEGRVVLPGETIATMAEDRFVLRLSLPERHARFMRAGDAVAIAAREGAGEARARAGRVRLVYPEIQGGRVVADVEVEGLGEYFVGERTRVEVSTGKRQALLVPAAAVYRRAGAHFVRLKSGAEIVVQPGDAVGADVEILSGLRPGDVIVTP